MRTCALSDDLSPFCSVSLRFQKDTRVCPLGRLVLLIRTVSLSPPRWLPSYAVFFFFFILFSFSSYARVLGPTAFISCFSILLVRRSKIRWQHQTFIILVNRFRRVCTRKRQIFPTTLLVEPFSLFFFFYFVFFVVFVGSFDVSRTTISLSV